MGNRDSRKDDRGSQLKTKSQLDQQRGQQSGQQSGKKSEQGQVQPGLQGSQSDRQSSGEQFSGSGGDSKRAKASNDDRHDQPDKSGTKRQSGTDEFETD